MDWLIFMAAPFVASILMVMIAGYMGIHILTRGVIFVDIALAQMAALGVAIGLYFDFELNSVVGILTSFVFTFVGALIISSIRKLEKKIPPEAYIGVIYVVGAALVILIADRLAHGAEHVKELLVGQILWVQWSDVAVEALVFLITGVLFSVFHKKLYSISKNHHLQPEESSIIFTQKQIFLYDVLFYTLFGIVITQAVRFAGVLLVFTLLVVPSIISLLFGKRFVNQLTIAWAAGIVISIMGLLLSYHFDLPTGATIVVVAGFLLIPATMLKLFTLTE